MTNTTKTNYTLIIIAVIVGGILGFLIGIMSGTSTVDNESMGTDSRENAAMQDDIAIEPAGSISGQVESTLVAGNETDTAFTIQLDSLAPEQQAMLRATGINDSEIVITNGMVACAETAIGAARVVAIKDGAEIAMAEGIALVGCYTKN